MKLTHRDKNAIRGPHALPHILLASERAVGSLFKTHSWFEDKPIANSRNSGGNSGEGNSEEKEMPKDIRRKAQCKVSQDSVDPQADVRACKDAI